MRHLLVFAVTLFGPVIGAVAQTPSDAVKAMVGAWEISNADRDKSCHLNFKAEAAKGGFRIEFDKDCPEIFPAFRDVESWVIANDFLRLLDGRGRIVFEFTEVESGMFEAERQGDGLYFLQNTAAAGPAFRTPEQMTGDWNVMRAAKPVCVISLADVAAGQDAFTLRLRQPCDAQVTRFNPTAWRMDRGELVLSAANGQSWRFEESEAAVWRRIPEGADPVTLVRK